LVSDTLLWSRKVHFNQEYYDHDSQENPEDQNPDTLAKVVGHPAITEMATEAAARKVKPAAASMAEKKSGGGDPNPQPILEAKRRSLRAGCQADIRGTPEESLREDLQLVGALEVFRRSLRKVVCQGLIPSHTPCL
jgi:hypothetical protein